MGRVGVEVGMGWMGWVGLGGKVVGQLFEAMEMGWVEVVGMGMGISWGSGW